MTYERIANRSMVVTQSSLGYVPGNIAVISHFANTMKQNCTDSEVFRRLADYLNQKAA